MARVLLVEPNDYLRRVFRRRFVREGFDLVEAADGEMALAAARAAAPDLIVLEEAVLGAAGRDLAADPELRMVPLIVLTGRPRWGQQDPGGSVILAVKEPAGLQAEEGGGQQAAAVAMMPPAKVPARRQLRELRHPFRPGSLVELARGILRSPKASEPPV